MKSYRARIVAARRAAIIVGTLCALTATAILMSAPPEERTPGQITTFDVGGDATPFHWIPGGTFTMGSAPDEAERDADELRHEVTLTRGFWMCEAPVTVEAYAKFAAATGYETEEERACGRFTYRNAGSDSQRAPFGQSARDPVVLVSWNDAQAYVAWLNANYAQPGRRFTLPSESQWERACRAGTDTIYWWGDDPEDGVGKANVADASASAKYPQWRAFVFRFDDRYAYTSPVGSFCANAWGLKDMTGNVWEWCSDFKGAYPSESVVDPVGASEGTYRVIRGGAWDSRAKYCRSAHRGGALQNFRYVGLGFRIAIIEESEEKN